MKRRATGQRATAYVLFLISLVPGAARAQAKRADPFVAAQQAFTRLDYPNAYRLALEALRSTPGNLEARRIAARSAKEMQRPGDCLRLLQPLKADAASADDVGLVGECAAASSFPAWSLTFLLQSTNNGSSKDMANYWLGRFYYRKGDYARAEGFLSQVTLLPARLERERGFMLERSREVLRAQATPPPEPATEPDTPYPSPTAPARPPRPGTQGGGSKGAQGNPNVTGTGTTLPPGIASSPTQGNKKETAQTSSNAGAPVRLTAASRSGLRKATAAGVFFDPWASGSAGGSIRKGEETPLGPDDQKDYAKAVADRKVDESKVEHRSVSEPGAHLDAGGGAQWGWSSALAPNGSQIRFGLDVRTGLTLAPVKLPVYAMPGEALLPQFSIRIPHQGWGAGFGPFLEWALNRNFSLLAKGGLALTGPSFKSTMGRVEGSGAVKIEFDPFEVRSGGRGGWLLGEDNQRGARYYEATADVRIGRWGWFGFGAPEGYPLVRYHDLEPVAGSKSVVLFTTLEGQFIEFNIAPRVFFGEQVSLMTWYRYVIGNARSYVSPTDVANGPAKVGAERKELFLPTADYTSVSRDWATEIEWAPLRYLSIAGGALVRQSITQYSEESYSTSPAAAEKAYQYVYLLDSGGESWVRYFLEVRASL